MIVTKTVYLIARPRQEFDSDRGCVVEGIEYFPWMFDKYEGGQCVSSVDVSFEVSEPLNPIHFRVEALEKEKASLQADFTARINKIQQQINECLAIEG